jgi:hypothetical protein
MHSDVHHISKITRVKINDFLLFTFAYRLKKKGKKNSTKALDACINIGL